MKRGQFKLVVLMELKSHPECEFEGKILLGCELLRSYMRQKKKTRRKVSCKKFEYSDFVTVGFSRKKIACFTVTF